MRWKQVPRDGGFSGMAGVGCRQQWVQESGLVEEVVTSLLRAPQCALKAGLGDRPALVEPGDWEQVCKFRQEGRAGGERGDLTKGGLQSSAVGVGGQEGGRQLIRKEKPGRAEVMGKPVFLLPVKCQPRLVGKRARLTRAG